MITFIKTKFKKSDDQTEFDKYSVATNITEYVKNQQLFFVTIIELQCFLHYT